MKPSARSISFVLAAAVILILGYVVMTTTESRTSGQKIGDVIDKLDSGFDNAARELEDRTPAEKIGDAVHDATDGQ